MAGGYPDLVAPIVPDAQHNASAQILLEGMKTGLAAVANFNNQRRESEMEIAKIAAQERIAQDQHAVEREKIYKDATAQDEMTHAHAQYYGAMTDLATAKAKSYAEGTATAAQRAVKFNQQRQEVVDDFNQQAEELQLTNPKFISQDPVQFALNLKSQQSQFASAAWMPEIRNGLTNFKRIADQQKVAYGTDQKPRPVMQIVDNLLSEDPEIKAKTVEDLRAAGHFKDQKVKGVPTQSWSRPLDTMWDAVIGPKDTTEQVPDAMTKSLLAKPSTYQAPASRVPPAMLPKSAAAGTSPTELPVDIPADTTGADYPPDASAAPASSATPDYQPTETDNFLNMAKAALAKGADVKAVANKLQEMGIDPSQMWA